MGDNFRNSRATRLAILLAIGVALSGFLVLNQKNIAAFFHQSEKDFNRLSAQPISSAIHSPYFVPSDIVNQAQAPSLLHYYTQPAVAQMVCGTDLKKSVKSWYKDFTPDGAHWLNADWEHGLRKNWFVEEQRYAMTPMICGVVQHRPELITAGFHTWDWTFDHADSDGGFSSSGDAFHSSSFFVESVAEVLTVLQQSPYADQYATQIQTYTAKLHRAANWMTTPTVWQKGTQLNTPYTHRRYLVAAALGLTSNLTHDRHLELQAETEIHDGLQQQTPEGYNPEKGGFDSSYNAVGLLFAQRWLSIFPHSSLAPAVKQMLTRSIAWEATRVSSAGKVIADGNTRTNGQEAGRDGTTKTVSSGTVMQVFSYWGLLTNDPQWGDLAQKIFVYTKTKS